LRRLALGPPPATNPKSPETTAFNGKLEARLTFHVCPHVVRKDADKRSDTRKPRTLMALSFETLGLFNSV
jgi:hypothetical protein